jgi:hypothetical protein
MSTYRTQQGNKLQQHARFYGGWLMKFKQSTLLVGQSFIMQLFTIKYYQV